MKITRFCLFVMLLGILGQVFGQTNPRPEGKFCSTQEGRLEYIQRVTSDYYDWLLKKVERVPPETEKYLSSEFKDSVETKNESRYQKVVNNQYFYPWRLRESIEKLNEESKTGFQRVSGFGVSKKNQQESEMIYYTNLLDKNFNVSDNFDEYSRFDRTRKKPYLKPYDDEFRMGLSKGLYLSGIQDLISCSYKK